MHLTQSSHAHTPLEREKKKLDPSILSDCQEKIESNYIHDSKLIRAKVVTKFSHLSLTTKALKQRIQDNKSTTR